MALLLFLLVVMFGLLVAIGGLVDGLETLVEKNPIGFYFYFR